MIFANDEAKVGDGAAGVTFRSTPYQIKINGKPYTLYDTVGLGEYSGGTVDSTKAVGNLYHLVTDLSNSGGVNLLVFVIKKSRLTETMVKNYVLFHRGFCDSKVPIVIIVTCCEDVEPTMDTWWINNKTSFTNAKMTFDGHACVCAFKGTESSGYRTKHLVGESAGVVKRLVVERCMRDGWKMVRRPPPSVTKLEASEFTDILPI